MAYMTKQRRALLNFLLQHHDEVFSAQQIALALQDQHISQSAVYRNLTALEQDDKIRRHVKSGSHEVYYQYINPTSCKGKIHLSCVKCLHSFHMNLADATKLAAQLASNNAFQIDIDNTVIYGVCSHCQEQKP